MHDISTRTSGGMRVDATDGVHVGVMDEPAEKGGNDEGLTPMQTLVASLGGCTAVTLKLYSARKAWPLEDVDVRVVFEPGERAARTALPSTSRSTGTSTTRSASG